MTELINFDMNFSDFIYFAMIYFAKMELRNDNRNTNIGNHYTHDAMARLVDICQGENRQDSQMVGTVRYNGLIRTPWYETNLYIP